MGRRGTTPWSRCCVVKGIALETESTSLSYSLLRYYTQNACRCSGWSTVVGSSGEPSGELSNELSSVFSCEVSRELNCELGADLLTDWDGS